MVLRRFAISTTVFIGAAILSAPAFADTVNIGGEVQDTSAVTSTATANAGTLDLAGEGVAAPDTVVHVADLALTSNSSNGVTLSASADSSLTNGVDSLSYQVQIVADNATAPTAGSFTANSDTKTVSDFTNGAAARDLYIEYDAPALLDAGAYSSSITVTVTDI